MVDQAPPSQYPQLPPDPAGGSWLARNPRLAILGGVVVILVGAIIVVPRIHRSRSPSSTTNTATTNVPVTSNTAATPTTSTSTFRRYTVSITPDQDHDGLSDAEEIRLGTNPTKADTDGDGLTDYDEVKIYHTNPLKADTDGDGVPDGVEVRRGTNPNGTGPLLDTNQAIHQAQTK